MEQMIKYIQDIIKDLDVFTEKRDSGGYIVVPYKLSHLSTRKNVFTYWPRPRASTVGLIILGQGYLPKNKTFHSVEEMEKSRVAEKILSKYIEMVG